MPIWLVKTKEIVFLRKSSKLAEKQFSQERTVMRGITSDKEHQHSGLAFEGERSSFRKALGIVFKTLFWN